MFGCIADWARLVWEPGNVFIFKKVILSLKLPTILCHEYAAFTIYFTIIVFGSFWAESWREGGFLLRKIDGENWEPFWEIWNIRNDDASATPVEKSNFIPCRLKASKV